MKKMNETLIHLIKGRFLREAYFLKISRLKTNIFQWCAHLKTIQKNHIPLI